MWSGHFNQAVETDCILVTCATNRPMNKLNRNKFYMCSALDEEERLQTNLGENMNKMLQQDDKCIVM